MGKRARLTRTQMLESTPRLNPEVKWQELDSGVLMAAYERQTGLFGGLARRLFAVPGTVQVALDQPGSRVVRAMDGTRTVGDLIALVGAEFRLSRKEAEVVLLKYLEMLGRRGLVGFEVRGATQEVGANDG